MAVRIEQKIKKARRISALSQINGGGRRNARRHSLGATEDQDADGARPSTTTATSQRNGTRRSSTSTLDHASRSAKALEGSLPHARTVPATQALAVSEAACAGNTQHISYTNFASEAVQSTRFARRHGDGKVQGRALPILSPGQAPASGDGDGDGDAAGDSAAAERSTAGGSAARAARRLARAETHQLSAVLGVDESPSSSARTRRLSMPAPGSFSRRKSLSSIAKVDFKALLDDPESRRCGLTVDDALRQVGQAAAAAAAADAGGGVQQSEGGDETGGSNATFNVFSEGEGDLRLRRGRRARNSLTQGALMVVAAETLAQGGRSRMSISARGGAAGGGGGEAASLRAQRHVTLLEQNKGMLKEYLVKQGTLSAVGDLDHIAAHIKRELAKRDTEVDVAAAHAAKKERAEEVLAQLPLRSPQMTWLRTVWLLRHSLWLHSHGSTRIARAELETMSVNKLRWFWKKNFARKMRELVDEFKEELSDGMKFKVIVAVRVLRKKHHVMRMRSFFRHFGGKPTVSLIARVFRGKIITCQQLARQFLACKRARIRSIGRVAYEIEERVREVEDFEPHRDSAEQHMHALEQDYHKTHDRVLTMMGSVTDAEAHSATVTASRQAIIHEHLAKWRKAHVAKHTDAYNEAIAVYNGKTGRELTVDEMRRLVHKSAAAMTNFVFGNADDEENEKPVWPTLILYSKLRHDEQFKHDVEAWVRRYPDGR